MSDLDSLNYKSILNMENDEAIEILRQIRLSRRTPARTKRKAAAKKAKNKKAPNVNAEVAAKILEILGGK